MLASVAGATALLAASAAAVPLFLSSVGAEAVAVQVGDRCSRDTGATLGYQASPETVAGPAADPFAAVAEDLGPTTRSARVETSLTDPATDISEPVVLLTREGALDHVDVVEGTPGPGVWISDRAAGMTGLAGAGATAVIGGAEVPVTGVYRDMAGTAVDDFWCVHAQDLLPEGREQEPPPPVVLTDAETFTRLNEGREWEAVAGRWDAPLRGGVTVDRAEVLIDDLACSTDKAADLPWCAGGRPALPTSYGRGPLGTGADIHARDAAEFVTVYLGSHLPFVVDRTEAIRTSVGGGVRPVAAFAGLAGVALVAASALLWYDRRRRELGLLTVRGVSPAALGLKGVLELILPLVAGTAAGVALAWLAVVWVGPSSTVEASAVGDAALAGLATLAVAAVVVGVVVALRVRAQHRGRPRRAWLRAVPWELLLGVAAYVSYRRLGQWGAPVSQGAEVSRVDTVGLLFPVLFLTAAVAITMRVLMLALGPLLRVSRGWPVALYLGVRRVARYRGAVVGLVAASAVAAGVLGYAATLRGSMDATLDAKSHTFIGSDVAVRVPADQDVPAEFAGRSTALDAYRQAWIEGDEREDVDVYALDPATFADAAYWDESMADDSLDDILDQLAAPPGDGPIPAVVVGADVADEVELGIRANGTTDVTVAPLDGVHAFPGMKRGSPTVFVAARRARRPRRHHRHGRAVGARRPRRHAGHAARRRRRVLRAADARQRGRPGVLPDRLVDVRLHAVARRRGGRAGDRRRRRAPGRPAAGARARLHVRPAHGVVPRPAPACPAGRAHGQRGRRLLARSRVRPGRGGPRHRAGSIRSPGSGPTPCCGRRSRWWPSWRSSPSSSPDWRR